MKIKIALFITVVLLILNAYKIITIESNDFVIRLSLKLSLSFFSILMFRLFYKLKKQGGKMKKIKYKNSGLSNRRFAELARESEKIAKDVEQISRSAQAGNFPITPKNNKRWGFKI